MQTKQDIIDECSGIINNPYGRLAEEHNRKYKYFGYNCIFVAEEIIHAAGFVPVKIFSDYKGTHFTDKYLPGQSCIFARGLIETFRAGHLDFLEGCAFTHCCDVLWGCYLAVKNFWCKDISYQHTPYLKNLKNAQHFMPGELEKFILYLEKTYHIKITDRDLAESIKVYKENNRLLQRLQCIWRDGRISGSDYFTLHKAGYYIPKERHNQLLSDLIQILEPPGEQKDTGKKTVKLMISGFINGEIDFIKYIEKAGAAVVTDDLCCFSRGLPCDYTNAAPSFSSPLQEISFNCMNKFCPVGMKDKEWYSILKEKYHQASADGIIFFIYPFCDQQAIEYVYLNQRLNEEGIKNLLIQPSLNFKSSGQLETRLEAFLEMITDNITELKN